MTPADYLDLTPEARHDAFSHLLRILDDYGRGIRSLRTAPPLDPASVRSMFRSLDFSSPLGPREAIDFVAEGLRSHQVHTAHPMYYGLFNPRPAAMGIAADAIVAAFNPQLAAWSHNPFAVEAEAYLVREFGKRFGYAEGSIDGTFCSGGAEANHTALLTALVETFPEAARGGLRALRGRPVFYVSEQSHHSFLKAARLCGLGTDALREIAVGPDLRMDQERLRERIASDRSAGYLPFMVVATAGTTGAGVIDPVGAIAEIARSEGLWMHTDAAWGGAAVFVEELRGCLRGIERSDSITFDAHKWLSVPMGAGMYMTNRPAVLGKTFRVTADYMPKEASALDVTDPYGHSIQWSRRFTGLKVLLSLMVAGWEGYAAAIRHQTAMGHLLRKELAAGGWSIVNETPLPLVCFVDAGSPGSAQRLCERAVASGRAWISTIRLRPDLTALRACITNYATTEKDVRALVELLNGLRRELGG